MLLGGNAPPQVGAALGVLAPTGVRSQIGTSAYNAFPSMVLYNTDDLRLHYRYGAEHNSADGEIDERISTDGGATWPASGTQIANMIGDGDLRDPALIRTSGGRYILVYDRRDPWNSTNIDTTRIYSDNGTTWSANYTLPAIHTGSLESVASGSIIETAGGDIIVPGFGQDTGDPEEVFLWTSTDNGATFGTPVVIATHATRDYQEPQLRILNSGRWLCLMRSESNHHTWRTYSDDDGATWSTPDDVNEMTGRPDFIEYRAGNLLQVGRYDTTGDSPTYYALSSNDGATWTTPLEVDVGETKLNMYCTLVKTTDGEVTMVYALESSSTSSGLYVRYFSDT